MPGMNVAAVAAVVAAIGLALLGGGAGTADAQTVTYSQYREAGIVFDMPDGDSIWQMHCGDVGIFQNLPVGGPIGHAFRDQTRHFAYYIASDRYDTPAGAHGSNLNHVIPTATLDTAFITSPNIVISAVSTANAGTGIRLSVIAQDRPWPDSTGRLLAFDEATVADGETSVYLNIIMDLNSSHILNAPQVRLHTNSTGSTIVFIASTGRNLYGQPDIPTVSNPTSTVMESRFAWVRLQAAGITAPAGSLVFASPGLLNEYKIGEVFHPLTSNVYYQWAGYRWDGALGTVPELIWGTAGYPIRPPIPVFYTPVYDLSERLHVGHDQIFIPNYLLDAPGSAPNPFTCTVHRLQQTLTMGARFIDQNSPVSVTFTRPAEIPAPLTLPDNAMTSGNFTGLATPPAYTPLQSPVLAGLTWIGGTNPNPTPPPPPPPPPVIPPTTGGGLPAGRPAPPPFIPRGNYTIWALNFSDLVSYTAAGGPDIVFENVLGRNNSVGLVSINTPLLGGVPDCSAESLLMRGPVTPTHEHFVANASFLEVWPAGPHDSLDVACSINLNGTARNYTGTIPAYESGAAAMINALVDDDILGLGGADFLGAGIVAVVGLLALTVGIQRFSTPIAGLTFVVTLFGLTWFEIIPWPHATWIGILVVVILIFVQRGHR